MKCINFCLLTLQLSCFFAIHSLSAQDTNVPSPIFGQLKERLIRAETERVAIIGIGDSNQRFGGQGYSFHMEKALAKRLGCYAASLVYYKHYQERDAPAAPSAPEALAKLAFSYWYIPGGSSASVSWKNGLLIVRQDHPLGIQGNLRFHLTYGIPENGAGIFTPMVRRDEAPWTILAREKPAVQTGPAVPGLVHYTLDLRADSTRNYPLQFSPTSLTEAIPGEFFATAAACENMDKQSGIAYHTLYAAGGQSLFDMLTQFKAKGPVRLAEYFSRVRELLNGKKTCVIMITSGLNDRNEKELSIGPKAGLASSTPEGFADNLHGIVTTLQEAWVLAGGTEDTLHFAFMPSHVLASPDDVKLVGYRQAARRLAGQLPNASMINLEELVPYEEMLRNKYYDNNASTSPHLDSKGYEAIADALIKYISAR